MTLDHLAVLSLQLTNQRSSRRAEAVPRYLLFASESSGRSALLIVLSLMYRVASDRLDMLRRIDPVGPVNGNRLRSRSIACVGRVLLVRQKIFVAARRCNPDVEVVQTARCEPQKTAIEKQASVLSR